MSEAYEQEPAEVRVAELMATLEKLYAYADLRAANGEMVEVENKGEGEG